MADWQIEHEIGEESIEAQEAEPGEILYAGNKQYIKTADGKLKLIGFTMGGDHDTHGT